MRNLCVFLALLFVSPMTDGTGSSDGFFGRRVEVHSSSPRADPTSQKMIVWVNGVFDTGDDGTCCLPVAIMNLLFNQEET